MCVPKVGYQSSFCATLIPKYFSFSSFSFIVAIWLIIAMLIATDYVSDGISLIRFGF